MKKIIKNVVVPAVIVAKLCAVDSYAADMAIETPDAMGQTSQIESLPTDLICKIAGYLDINDIINLRGTNSTFRQILTSTNIIEPCDRWHFVDLSNRKSLAQIKSMISLSRTGLKIGFNTRHARSQSEVNDYFLKIRNILINTIKIKGFGCIGESSYDYEVCNDYPCRELLNSLAFENLTHLSLSSNKITDETISVLVQHKFSLNYLNLAVNRIRDYGAELLANWESIKCLKHLDLSRNQISSDGLEALAVSPYLHELEYLNIYDNWGYPFFIFFHRNLTKLLCLKLSGLYFWNMSLSDYVSDFVSAHGFRCSLVKLRHLCLSGSNINYNDLRYLINFVPPDLESLDLTSVSLVNCDLITLFSSKNLENLQNLNLCNTKIGDSELLFFAENSIMPKLKDLNLSNNKITFSGAVKLMKSRKLDVLDLGMNDLNDVDLLELDRTLCRSNIKELSLTNSQLKRRDASELYQPNRSDTTSGLLLKLEKLDLYGCSLGSSELAYMLDSGIFSNLKSLNLRGTKINFDALKILFSSPMSLTKLYELYLSAGDHGDETAMLIAESSSVLSNLRILVLTSKNIGNTGIMALRNSPIFKTLTDLFVTNRYASNQWLKFSNNQPSLRERFFYD